MVHVLLRVHEEVWDRCQERSHHVGVGDVHQEGVVSVGLVDVTDNRRVLEVAATMGIFQNFMHLRAALIRAESDSAESDILFIVRVIWFITGRSDEVV